MSRGENSPVPRDDDPRVAAAREAERRLYRRFGLEVETSLVMMERYGIRVRCVESGRGRPLFIVPGNTGDGYPFVPLIPRLAGFRTIVINRPGGGLSDGIDHRAWNYRRLAVDTLDAVFDHYSIDHAPVIAHSMGGQWCLWHSLERPGRIGALALPGVPGNILDTAPPFVLRLASIPGLNRLFFRAVAAKRKERALKSLEFMGHSAKTLENLPEEFAECSFRFQKLPFYELSSLSLMETANGLFGAKKDARLSADDLRRIGIPVLLLWGENDPFGRADTGRRIAGILPRGEFRAVPGAGHLPWLDAPDFCAESIRAFLSA